MEHPSVAATHRCAVERDWGQSFRFLLEKYRREDGSTWSGAHVENATNGVVPARYFSQLKRGIIKEPSFTKVLAISRAMGISIEEWAKDDCDD